MKQPLADLATHGAVRGFEVLAAGGDQSILDIQTIISVTRGQVTKIADEARIASAFRASPASFPTRDRPQPVVARSRTSGPGGRVAAPSPQPLGPPGCGHSFAQFDLSGIRSIQSGRRRCRGRHARSSADARPGGRVPRRVRAPRPARRPRRGAARNAWSGCSPASAGCGSS